MIARRDLLLGGGLLLGAGAAFALTPRKRLDLLGSRKLEALIPTRLGPWAVTPSDAVVLPKAREGSLADRLYSQTVSRLYTSETQLPVMLVVAYGSTQSDQLQLHRPEVCYAAVGFQVAGSRDMPIPLGQQAALPARALVASTDQRIEPILYWTRIGDSLPTTGETQRMAKLKGELDGYVADGVLVRMSTVAEPTEEAFASLRAFARTLVNAMPAAGLPSLIGRPLAKRVHQDVQRA